jgi:hypothetical protein
MNRHSQLKHSRRGWKTKSIANGDGKRYWRRQYKRVAFERDRYKDVAKKAQRELAEYKKQNRGAMAQEREDLVFLALQLFLVAKIGFRAAARVLQIIGHHLGIAKPPCTQTVINWIMRLSIVRITNSQRLLGTRIAGDRFSNGFIWMIDISIGLSDAKILAVLALNVLHHESNSQAATLEDVHCIGTAVAVSWTGENVADFLQELINGLGRPAAFLKDGGKELAKAVSILEDRGLPSETIDDISHVVANLFKHEYVDDPKFDIFTSTCGKVSKKLKQSVLACLAPPKVSTKARFMNLHHLIRWADQLLQHCPTKRARNGTLTAKLQASLGKLSSCREFIARFHQDAVSVSQCQQILKNKGLSSDTWRECEKVITAQVLSPSIHDGLKTWANNHLELAQSLGVMSGLPTTSDQLESLYGVGKHHGTGQILDANRIATRLPAMSGKLTKEDAVQVLEVSVAEQQKVFGSLPSLTKQRREVLPNPGSLESLKPEPGDHHLRLSPRAIMCAKNLIKNEISGCYEYKDGPIIDLNSAKSPPPNTSPPVVMKAV